jgi:hypothetical protein
MSTKITLLILCLLTYTDYFMESKQQEKDVSFGTENITYDFMWLYTFICSSSLRADR